jgi:general L-amino acid transport system substrate-binding protein
MIRRISSPLIRAGAVLSCVAAVILSALPATAATANTLTRAKARGVVRCAAVERPGLAEPSSDGHWQGLEVDVCRAIATAALGSPDRIAFRAFATMADARAVGQGKDDVYFLTGSEISDFGLADRLVPGPAVFFESHAVMVPAAAREQHLDDLAGQSICFVTGSPVGRSLYDHFASHGLAWRNMPFAEDGEMIDAYNVQRCHAVAYEITTLATVRWEKGINNLDSRILPEPVTTFPVLAATSADDGRWAALVAWTVHTLVAAERPETRWYPGGAAAMPVEAGRLGLDKTWQSRVVAAVGTYADIFERNLGDRSPLKLTRGPNAAPTEGGLLAGPFVE